MVAACAFAWIAACEGTAAAQPTPQDRAMADALFKEAKALMARDQYDAACPKLEESNRLDPLGGTLLNLAMCHEAQGRVATALVEYQEAVVRAGRDRRMDRVQTASTRIAALEGHVPRLAVQVSQSVAVEGLKVRRNQLEIPEAAWGTAVPVDPGDYVVTASAPGKKTWTAKVRLDLGDRKTVEVEALDDAPAPAPTKTVAAPSPRPLETNEGRRVAAIVTGGVGMAALGIGIFAGISALSKDSDSEKHCAGNACDAQGVSLNQDALRAANISNVGIGAGLVGLGIGTWLWVTSGPTPQAAPAARYAPPRFSLRPEIASRSTGLVLEGPW
jgi:hypothetical protein